MPTDLRYFENETISDFENQDLAVVGPGDRSGMVFGLTRDRLRRQPCSRGLVLVLFQNFQAGPKFPSKKSPTTRHGKKKLYPKYP